MSTSPEIVEGPRQARINTRSRGRRAIPYLRVTACEEYITRTTMVSNTTVNLHYLRPDRDSNAGPTA